MSVLSFRDVSKRYAAGREHVTVLEHVSFDIEEGDFIGIQAERRSGKSTLLRIAAGWELPDEGGVIFAGHDLTRISNSARAKLRRRGGIGLAAGNWRPTSNKSVVGHVAEVLLCDRMSMREAKEPAYHALERVGLAHCSHMRSNRLSQSEIIRLGLAQRLVHEPRLLLVDEPAVLLKPSEAVELYELLSSLGREPNLAVAIASEDLTPIRMARRMMSLDRGRLRWMDKAGGTVVDFPDHGMQARQRSQP